MCFITLICRINAKGKFKERELMIKTKAINLSFILAAATLLIAVILPAVRVEALSSSSLLLSDPRPSQTSNYTFSTSGLTTATTINCMQLDIGTSSDGSGDAGLDLSGISLVSQTIPSSGTWADASVDGTTDQLRATSAGGATPNATGNVVWGGIVNGATAGTTYYGVFETFSNTDCSTGGPVDSATVAFIYKDGELVQLTVDPTLTFTCAGVASGQPINGATTNTTSVGSGIDFGNITSATKGVSAHDLQVSTNATGGYTLYTRHTGALSNGTDNIDWSGGGSNASPTSFPAAGTEAWGYTTDDNALLTGTADRFTSPANQWAKFETSNEIVGDSASATSGTETTRVGHQVGISATTPAGTYQTTVVYTVASTY